MTSAGVLGRGEVLVVEDTVASRQLLSDLLTGAGYTARLAQDGPMAIRSAQASPPDLILLDVRMPGMDGYEVCRRLKTDRRTQEVPIIFLSALRETEDKVRAFSLGAVDYIAKPYQPDEVLARVQTHVELGRLRGELERRVEERTAQLQESQGRLRELAEFLQTVREDERTRIARELHDELGQSLTALRIDLNWLLNRIEQANPATRERLQSALGLVERTVDAVRRISEDLRPRMLDDLGLAAAVEYHVAQFAERSGIPCSLSMNREEFDIDSRSATAVFRMVQETLTNVARHAGATNVAVRIEQSAEGMHLAVRDDGRGFVEETGRKTFGLIGMRERIAALGGRLEIDSVPDQGTAIEAWIPSGKGTA